MLHAQLFDNSFSAETYEFSDALMRLLVTILMIHWSVRIRSHIKSFLGIYSIGRTKLLKS
jgi:steroid 5-alpha reductase family enzyme